MLRRGPFASALALVVILTVFRVIAAALTTLTGDEAYYWSWSRHLGFGYTDHPPMVAWLIALGTLFGSTSLSVRFPFILCEAIAAIAVGRAAWLLSGEERAGAIAAVAFQKRPSSRGTLLLGAALAGAVLARWFGWALVFGIAC